MTRFARARGSKGSNERVPELATPWSVMKQQFLNVRREDFSVEGRSTNNTHFDRTSGSNGWTTKPATPRIETNRQFLNDRGENSSVEGKDEIIHNQLSRNEKQVETVWEDFGGIKKKNTNHFNGMKNVSKSSKSIKKMKIKRELGDTFSSSVRDSEVETISSFPHEPPVSAKSGNVDIRKKKKTTVTKLERSENTEKLQLEGKVHENDYTNAVENGKKKKSKENKTIKHNFDDGFSVSANSGNLDVRKIKKDTGNKVERFEKLQSVDKTYEDDDMNAFIDGKKKNIKKNKTIKHNLSNEFSVSANSGSFEKLKSADQIDVMNALVDGNKKKMKKNKTDYNFGKKLSCQETNDNLYNTSKETCEYNSKLIYKKETSENDYSHYFKEQNNYFGTGRRNNFDDYPDTMMIGGNIVEIGEFQGFPVKKEDEVRLKTLRKELQAKGIPRKEIEYVLKGERRRAEKALAREKKIACFNCRKFGHNVAECPELGDQTEVGKVCFKCGSTEHKYLDCKVVSEKDAFRFAECFICKEQGHISRQCPDNPRGLYPKGGACKICGSVTHLRKDCPDLVIGKEKSTITLGTVDQSSALEALDEEVTHAPAEYIPHKKKRKIVKF